MGSGLMVGIVVSGGDAGLILLRRPPPALSPLSRDPRCPERADGIRLPELPLPRVRPAARPLPEEGAGARGDEEPRPPPAPGADGPAGHRPRGRRVPRVAASVRQPAVPGRHAVRPGAAQKKSGDLIVECDELWSFVQNKQD